MFHRHTQAARGGLVVALRACADQRVDVDFHHASVVLDGLQALHFDVIGFQGGSFGWPCSIALSAALTTPPPDAGAPGGFRLAPALRARCVDPANGPDVEVPYVAASVINNTTKYSSAAGNASIELITIKKNCSDGMSEEIHPYEVTLRVNKTKYSGCGRKNN